MTHFVTDSKVVKTTSNKNHHIFEPEFMASESFFDNTAFFFLPMVCSTLILKPEIL